METAGEGKAANRRLGRRWQFGPAVLDEPSWTLLIDGRRMPVEAKPLEVLHELLLHSGEVVTKDELLDAVWPGVSVVEASLPTAILKLRRALGDERGAASMIETVPRIGYRLAGSVDVTRVGTLSQEDNHTAPLTGQKSEPRTVTAASPSFIALINAQLPISIASLPRRLIIEIVALLALIAGLTAISQIFNASPVNEARHFTQRDAANALRKLDVDKIETMLAAGWSPNTPFNVEGDGAINMLLNVCEWDPQHDQRQLMLVARTLLEGGAQLDRRNQFGDTAYSIAKAPRFCGPDHPVTKMLHTLCYAGASPPGDRCLATYELGTISKAMSEAGGLQ